jgi:hypothetical protein
VIDLAEFVRTKKELAQTAMNEAFLYEKVGAEEQLTSDIFGLLRYLPPELILVPLLQRAICFDDSAEGNLAQWIGFSPTKVAFFFWPAAHIPAAPNSCSLDRQPDVPMLLRDNSGNSAGDEVCRPESDYPPLAANQG